MNSGECMCGCVAGAASVLCVFIGGGGGGSVEEIKKSVLVNATECLFIYLFIIVSLNMSFFHSSLLYKSIAAGDSEREENICAGA